MPTRKLDIERKKRNIERKRKALEAQIIALRADFESEESEAAKMIETEQNMIKRLEQDKIKMAQSRKAEVENGSTAKLKE
jgi:circadian clock protein KaiC